MYQVIYSATDIYKYAQTKLMPNEMILNFILFIDDNWQKIKVVDTMQHPLDRLLEAFMDDHTITDIRKGETIYRLQEDDMRCVAIDNHLPEQYVEEFVQFCHERFEIHDWTEHVEAFLSIFKSERDIE